jgi:hypothetical protein
MNISLLTYLKCKMIIDLIVVLKKREDPDPKEIISHHIREAQNVTAIYEDMFSFYPKLSWCSLKAEVRRLVQYRPLLLA